MLLSCGKNVKLNERHRNTHLLFLVPSKPVITLKARNTSHTSLFVEWSDIPRDFVHGILLGFRVLFWRSNESRDTYEMREIAPDKSSVHLKDLWIYTKYKIQILGFTAAGEGAVSKELEVSTDEFSKFFLVISRALNSENDLQAYHFCSRGLATGLTFRKVRIGLFIGWNFAFQHQSYLQFESGDVASEELF